ncbi:lytic murein transglycosylase [Brevundimonas faecalis]|uniref:lytic murein transglycosylase n=1 Tax=Brevundimonas faecalis TaxID=947378 RepID=UPI003621F0D3
MRIAYRLLLIGSVAACAPMVPTPPQPQPLPPAVVEPAPATPTPTAPPASADLSDAYDQASFESWKQGFLNRHGGDRKWEYSRELQSVTPNPSVIRLDRNQPEFSRPAGVYIQNATAPARIAMARQRQDRVPWEVTQRFGVPTEILLGVWAQESAFGQVQGDFDVIRSLATLAYEGRRRDWAEGQLKNALDIVVDGRRARSGLKGSWAGAMGQTQFMPDNYLKLGVDQNGDGKVDIWGSDADALASAANLLAQAGWKRGQGWAYEVVLPTGFDYAEAEGPKHPWSYWAARGVRLANGAALDGAEAAEGSAILLPQGAKGPAFLALPNHYVIRRYNNSVSYALAIGMIADGVQGKPGLTTAWPNDGPLTREQRVGAQTALTRMGFDTQGVDGVIGSNTRAALRRWQQANSRVADGYLTDVLADELIRRGR